MKDFTPLLRQPARKFAKGVAEERLERPKSEAEVITPLRGLDGVRAVTLADHTDRAPKNLYARPAPGPAEPSEPLPPPGPTEEEIAAMIAAAEAVVRAEYEQKLADRDEQVEAAVTALRGVADTLDAHRTAMSDEARAQAGGLVLGAVQRVCGELPEALQGLVRDRLASAAESLVGSNEVILRVRPADLGLAARAIGDRPGWRLEPDASLKGGCVATSDAGTIDGSLSAAMEGIGAAAATWRAETGAGEKR